MSAQESRRQLKTSRKRIRVPAEKDGRAAKRKEIVSPDLLTRYAAIHEAIKAMPDNLDLSNPSTFTSLPFPSPLKPTWRFERKKINGIDHFEYMGRSRFHELQKRVEFLDIGESLYLFGTSGSGKSHLLAALAYHLIREGKRVMYIPNCLAFLLDPAETLWTALTFAFYDSPADLGTIGDPTDVNALIRFMKNYRDLYIFVDQVNVLEPTAKVGVEKMKDQVVSWLGALRSRHRYIFSASANEFSSREADRKQWEISVFRVFGGMNQDETDQWFIRHAHQIPQLSVKQRQCVEYLTGRIPLLLRSIINIKSFVELEFRNILRHIGTDVRKFFNDKFDSLGQKTKDEYLTITRECVQGDRVTSESRGLYDFRYSYVDEDGFGRVTCGIALEAMMKILREHDSCQFLDDGWYRAVLRTKNTITRAFLAEYICLCHIGNNGLMTVDPRLGRMATEQFESAPTFTNFLSTDDHNTRLYVPKQYNFEAVDGVILTLDRKNKKATMFPIQFTLSSKHKQSDKTFYTKFWPTWSEPITSAGFDLQSTFVWIDKKQPSKHVEHEVVKALRSGDKIIRPKYSVVHVGVEMVNPRLASVLDIKR